MPSLIDVGYGPDPRHMFDIHYPDAPAPEGGWPYAVWIHGGGWWGGDKADNLAIPLTLLTRGVAVVSVNYRLSGSGAFPVHIADVLCALRMLRVHAGAFGLTSDPAKIGLWGASAGAHLAVMAGAMTGQPSEPTAFLRHDRLEYLAASEAVAAVCAWFGPSVLNKMNEDAAAQVAEGGATNGRVPICNLTSQESHLLGGSASPMNPCTAPGPVHNKACSTFWLKFATAPLPVFRVEHGVKDPTTGLGGDRSVPVGQSRRVRDVVTQKGGAVVHLEHPGRGHGLGAWGPHADAAADWFAYVLGVT